MDLNKIITIAGKSGLYKIIADTRNGFVVESLTDGRKIPVFATERSSVLEDINIYTVEGEMPLKDVLWNIFEKEGGQEVSFTKKDQAAALSKFEEILPEYDKERVYFSDIKKVFSWYNLLLEKDMISKPAKDNEPAAEGEEAEEEKGAKKTGQEIEKSDQKQ